MRSSKKTSLVSAHPLLSAFSFDEQHHFLEIESIAAVLARVKRGKERETVSQSIFESVLISPAKLSDPL